MLSSIHDSDIKFLQEILSRNNPVWDVISRSEELNIPNYYIGAGCIAQTIWNHFHGFELTSFIDDIDFVYFDNSDISIEKENEIIQKVLNTFFDTRIRLDIKNQARVHVWYKQHFGYDIEPYSSIHEAIETWPTTSTSIGVKLIGNRLSIIAPFGLDDLLNLIVRPNKKQITEEIYMSKVNRWRTKWPKLSIIPW